MKSCGTSKDVAVPYSSESLMGYAISKAASEKESLRYNCEMEIVSLVCGLVGGGTLLSSMPESMGVLISQVTKNKTRYNTRFLEELLGKVPILHVEDVCDAHIFCPETPSIKGIFLCASAYLSSSEIASHYRKNYPDMKIPDEFVEKSEREIVWGSTKRKEVRFEYKCDVKTILEDSINCGLKLDPDSHSMEKESKVCVTGAASFLGSWLVKKLLEKGYVVHATIRNLGDPNKVSLLKSLPNAVTKLRLFEADLYNPIAFKHAIEGCEYVVHMATPLLHQPLNSQFKNTSEAAVAGVKSVLESCIRSGTVKRLIYTASVTGASPIKENRKGFRDRMDESCWTLQDISLPYSNELLVVKDLNFLQYC
ncbi:hypothetical protein CRYUN_Cryun14cG0043900 [Craigia yunnanensis]